MKSMREYAQKFQQKHLNGKVTKVTDCNFTFEVPAKKDKDKPKTEVYYLSYFWNNPAYN